jgi:hypothetical protein
MNTEGLQDSDEPGAWRRQDRDRTGSDSSEVEYAQLHETHLSMGFLPGFRLREA